MNQPYNNSSGGAPPLPYDPKSLDVYKDYDWTLSKEIVDYVPYIELIEYKLKQSGELISLKQSAAALGESLTSRAVIALAGGTRALESAQAAGNGLIEQSLKAAAGAGAATLATEMFIDSFAGLDTKTPYAGLYPAEPTKWIYRLPYLNVENINVDSGWAPVDTKALGNALVGLGQYAGIGALLKGKKDEPSLLETALQAREVELLLTEPGAAIEKIKKFTPSDKGDQINLTFYLFNTINIDSIKKNWEFLFTLTYQNLPNRRSINLLDPPCVYNVTVPGYKNFPVAVIEKLTITNEGTTRLININSGEVVTNRDDPDVKIIPEAFKVVLTIRSLFTPTQNLFYYSSNNKDKILNVFDNKTNKGEYKKNSVAQRQSSSNAFGGGVGGAIPRGGYPR